MKIRSITYFQDLGWPLDPKRIQQCREFLNIARRRFEEGGYEVQTTRLATSPFPLLLEDSSAQEVVNYAKSIEEILAHGAPDYASIGPALPDNPSRFEILPEILANTQSVFVAGVISSPEFGISPQAIRQSASVIKRNALISDDGFANLRFAALANVQPGGPFLPAAYHRFGGLPRFAIATEAADLAVRAIQESGSLQSARDRLVDLVEQEAANLSDLGTQLAVENKVDFAGIDFSLAPYPRQEQSIGTAIELLGVPGIGYHGSLAAVAILAEALDRAHYPRVGFSGVMLPLLEDTVLAQRAIEETLDINNLLLYSAVCGTGIDTVPLPGDISEEKIYALLLDLAVLAERLDKSLTARLMPVPGKKVGDRTDFHFEYFENSKVMDIKAKPISGFLAADQPYKLVSRPKAN